MKILLAMNLPYYPTLGGANKGNRFMVEALAEKGHELRVVVPALGTPSNITHDEFIGRLEADGIAVVCDDGVDRFKLNGVEAHAVEMPTRLRTHLVEQINEFAPEWVLVASEEPTQKLLQAALAAAPGRVIYVAQTPSFLPFGPQSFYPSPKRTKLLGEARAIVASSKFLANYIKQWSGLDARAVYMPVYGKGPFPNFGRFDGGCVTMVNPCQLKGISIFLSLAREMPDVQFAAVPTWGTTGDDVAALESLENVTLLEATPEFDQILSRTRVLLMPSLWLENFPLTAMEAMLRGIPVLGSNVGGIPEIKLGTDYVLPVRPIEEFTESLDGNEILIPVVPEQDINPWKAALHDLIAERSRYERQSMLAREAATNFVSSLTIDPLEELMNQSARSNGKPISRSKPDYRLREMLKEDDSIVELIDSLSAEQQALLMLLLRGDVAKGFGHDSSLPEITRVPRGGNLPVSFAQRRIWFVQQLDLSSPAYNLPIAIRIEGELDERRLKGALQGVVERQEVLRTRYKEQGGELVQVIEEEVEMRMPVVDLREVSEEVRGRESEAIARRVAGEVMSLREVPVMKAVLIREGEREGVLVVVMHHIASDGWSMGVMIEEVGEEYERGGRIEKREGGREEGIGYVDYAVWQRERMREGGMEEEVGYWKEQLRGAGAALELPTDRPRPESQLHRGATRPFALSKEITDSIDELSRRNKLTLFMTMLAGFNALLYSYSGQEDIVIGTDVANRTRLETERMIGCFVNQLALRANLSGNPTVSELLGRAKDVALQAYSHQNVPFERVVQELNPGRDAKAAPIFQVKLVLQNAPERTIELEGLRLTGIRLETGAAQIDINLNMTQTPEGMRGAIQYSSDLFDGSTIDRIFESYKKVLELMAVNEKATLKEIKEIVQAAEREALGRREKAFAEASLSRFKRARRSFTEATPA